jgi:hypothetical protein
VPELAGVENDTLIEINDLHLALPEVVNYPKLPIPKNKKW